MPYYIGMVFAVYNNSVLLYWYYGNIFVYELIDAIYFVCERILL